MSLLWAYNAAICDGEYCPNDCDRCHKAEIASGADALERVSASKAKPASKCDYPACEECDKYHGHYCTVPMVVSKQKWLLTEALLVDMANRLTELEKLVTDEILGSGKRNNTPEQNLTWEDYLREDEK